MIIIISFNTINNYNSTCATVTSELLYLSSFSTFLRGEAGGSGPQCHNAWSQVFMLKPGLFSVYALLRTRLSSPVMLLLGWENGNHLLVKAILCRRHGTYPDFDLISQRIYRILLGRRPLRMSPVLSHTRFAEYNWGKWSQHNVHMSWFTSISATRRVVWEDTAALWATVNKLYFGICNVETFYFQLKPIRFPHICSVTNNSNLERLISGLIYPFKVNTLKG